MDKKITYSLLGLMFIAWASTAFADQSNSAKAHVYLNISPNIAVQALDPVIDAGSLQSGDATVPIPFRVDANTEQVWLSALVTPLYKGNDPTGEEVEPIPVNLSAGVEFDPEHANELAGGNGVASYVGSGSVDAPEGTFPGSTTEQLGFESSQNGHFSQTVLVSPTWTNDDPEKPQGEYSGYVVLYAAVGGI